MKKSDPIGSIVGLALVASVAFLLSGVVASFLRVDLPRRVDEPVPGAADPNVPFEVNAARTSEAPVQETRSLDVQRLQVEGIAGAPPIVDGPELLIEGRVLDRQGFPLGEASVWLELRPGSRLAGVPGARSNPVQTATDGSFAFIGRSTLPANGSLALLVTAPGHAPHVMNTDLEPGSDWLDLGDIQLFAGGGLTGSVTDSLGNSVAGAQALLQPGSGHPLEAWGSTAETHASGRFRFSDLAPGSYRLSATAPGMQEGRFRDSILVEAGHDTAVDAMVLTPGLLLAGRVVAPDERPVLGAEVRVRGTSSSARFNQRMLTNGEGTFRFEHVPSGPLQLEVRASGFLRGRQVDVDAAADSEVVVRLEAGLAVHGTVVDAETRAPIERFAARIRLLGSVDRTDPRLPIEVLRRQIRELRNPAAEPGTREERARSDALASELEARQSAFEAGRDSSRLTRQPSDVGPVTERPEGRFEFAGLDEGVYAVDVASMQHPFASVAPVTVRRDAPPPELHLELRRGITLSGMVVARSDGAPLADASVDLVRIDEELSSIPDGHLRDGSASRFGFAFAAPGARGDLLATARTDGSGRFVLGPADPGRYLLRASHERAAAQKSEPFDLKGDRDDFRIVLGASATLRGRIRGLPVDLEAQVEVLAVGGFGVVRAVRARADQTYQLDRLPPGTYALRAYVVDASDALERHMTAIFSGEGSTPAWDVALAEGEQREHDLELELPRVGTVEGWVRVNDQPGRGLQVVLRAAPGAPPGVGRTQRTVLDPQGRFTLRNVAIGGYVLQVTSSTSRQELHREALSVSADSITSVRANLWLGGLRGRVGSGDGSAADLLEGTITLLPGATAAPADLREYGRTNRMHVVRVHGGVFEAENLTAGPALLIVEVRGREAVQTTIDVPVAATKDVVLAAGRVQ